MLLSAGLSRSDRSVRSAVRQRGVLLTRPAPLTRSALLPGGRLLMGWALLIGLALLLGAALPVASAGPSAAAPGGPAAAGQRLVPGETLSPSLERVRAATRTATGQWRVRGAAAAVAVLDTGVDRSSPDLVVRPGVDCVDPGTPPDDADGHGTEVATVLAGRNTGRGVVGLAPGTPVVPVRVSGPAGPTGSSLVCGLRWITATRTDADPGNDIAVANLSLTMWGGPADLAPCARSTALHRAVCAAAQAGITLVAAAGNEAVAFDSPERPRLPAAYPEVLVATAVTDTDGRPGGAGPAPTCNEADLLGPDDVVAPYSNYALYTGGRSHVVAAPGSCVTASSLRGAVGPVSGTSFAAPAVSGTVALCLSATAGRCRGLSATQLPGVLTSSAAAYGFDGDPTRPRPDGQYYGRLLDVAAAVR